MARFNCWEALEQRHLMAGDFFVDPAGLLPHGINAADIVGSIQPSAGGIEPQAVGSLSGYKFLDINGNRVRDVAAGSDPHFLFVLDASGSTGQSFGSSSMTRLEAHIAGIREFHGELLRRELGQAKLGILVFSSTAGALDMDPTMAGVQGFVAATDDRNGNREPDFLDVLATIRSRGATNLEAAVDATIASLEQAGSEPANTHVVFLTDGVSSRGGEFLEKLPRLRDLAGTIRAFATSDTDLSDLKRLDERALAFMDLRALRTAMSSLRTVADIRFTEVGVPGIRIYLDQNVNSAIDPGERVVTTREDDPATRDIDEAGFYAFENLPVGWYVIREEMRTGSKQTAPIAGAYTVRIGVSEVELHGLGYDFGNRVTGGIRGVVFRDFNRNGLQDPSEPGVAGMTVYLDRDQDGIHDPGEPSILSAQVPAGHYEFKELSSGTYLVRVVPRSDVGDVSLGEGGHIVVVNGNVVEANFAVVSSFIPEPEDPLISDSGRPQVPLTVLTEIVSQRRDFGGPIEPAIEPFISPAGGRLAMLPPAVVDASPVLRQPWLQAIEPETEELLPALAEVLSPGVFDPDHGDPPPPLRKISEPKPVDDRSLVSKEEGSDNQSDANDSVDGEAWSPWWWSLVPISAMTGGLWWRYGPRLWRSPAPYFARRAKARAK